MQLYEHARRYIGAPFKHRGRGISGMDCAGLVWCAYRDAGILLPDLSRYGREPNNNGQMMKIMADCAGAPPVWMTGEGSNPVFSALTPGDVIVIRNGIQPHHMAIVSPGVSHKFHMIHADSSLRVQKVVEHGLIDWHLDRIFAVFRRAL